MLLVNQSGTVNGQHGVITEVYAQTGDKQQNAGLFQADNGVKYTVLEKEFKPD